MGNKAPLPPTGVARSDLAIVGGGSFAFAAAFHAGRKDLRVIMVERDHVGGTCVNAGCIPSKASSRG